MSAIARRPSSRRRSSPTLSTFASTAPGPPALRVEIATASWRSGCLRLRSRIASRANSPRSAASRLTCSGVARARSGGPHVALGPGRVQRGRIARPVRLGGPIPARLGIAALLSATRVVREAASTSWRRQPPSPPRPICGAYALELPGHLVPLRSERPTRRSTSPHWVLRMSRPGSFHPGDAGSALDGQVTKTKVGNRDSSPFRRVPSG